MPQNERGLSSSSSGLPSTVRQCEWHKNDGYALWKPTPPSLGQPSLENWPGQIWKNRIRLSRFGHLPWVFLFPENHSVLGCLRGWSLLSSLSSLFSPSLAACFQDAVPLCSVLRAWPCPSFGCRAEAHRWPSRHSARLVFVFLKLDLACFLILVIFLHGKKEAWRTAPGLGEIRGVFRVFP